MSPTSRNAKSSLGLVFVDTCPACLSLPAAITRTDQSNTSKSYRAFFSRACSSYKFRIFVIRTLFYYNFCINTLFLTNCKAKSCFYAIFLAKRFNVTANKFKSLILNNFIPFSIAKMMIFELLGLMRQVAMQINESKRRIDAIQKIVLWQRSVHGFRVCILTKSEKIINPYLI